ncbi:MAG TPA: hypothetical protein VMZ28_17000 [Kofleriaceae bacterium]|nr:hypothetical protein [Kofleriaceae bacterium]
MRKLHVIACVLVSLGCGRGERKRPSPEGKPPAPADAAAAVEQVACPEGTSAHRTASADGTTLECQRPDGTRHGPSIGFHAGGLKAVERTYRDGAIDGEVTFWHPNGQQASKMVWRDGNEHGTATWWYPGGQKQAEITYNEGRPHGTSHFWDEAGVLVRDEVHLHGHLESRTTYGAGKAPVTETLPRPFAPRKVVAQRHPRIDPAWQTCEVDLECEVIATRCCACGSQDHVAVHYRHSKKAGSAVKPDCNGVDCPAMMCEQIGTRCDQGTCGIGQ